MSARYSIYKYPIPVDDVVDVAMPNGAVVLCVQTQAGTPCVWALVDTTADLVHRRFHMLGTGHPADDIKEAGDRGDMVYVGTFQLLGRLPDGGSLVFHLFDEGEV